jgi:hypothetical protein
LENLVFGAWGLEVDTKGLESINEFIPSISCIKNLVSLTLIPLPVIDKAWVEEEARVGNFENPKLEFEVGKASWKYFHMESSKYNL